jgi:large subunit ribosomal protein L6
LPEGIKAQVEKQTLLTIKGSDKELVGEIAAKIRALRKPDVYKNKGVKYADEKLKKKAGKSGK